MIWRMCLRGNFATDLRVSHYLQITFLNGFKLLQFRLHLLLNSLNVGRHRRHLWFLGVIRLGLQAQVEFERNGWDWVDLSVELNAWRKLHVNPRNYAEFTEDIAVKRKLRGDNLGDFQIAPLYQERRNIRRALQNCLWSVLLNYEANFVGWVLHKLQIWDL